MEPARGERGDRGQAGQGGVHYRAAMGPARGEQGEGSLETSPLTWDYMRLREWWRVDHGEPVGAEMLNIVAAAAVLSRAICQVTQLEFAGLAGMSHAPGATPPLVRTRPTP
jgi:hypothetical protein